MRAAIALLFAILPWSVSAQAEQDQNLPQAISKLRACVQTNAPSAQASGVHNTDDVSDFFFRKCGPSTSEFDTAKGVPPGIFRRTLLDEWRIFVEARAASMDSRSVASSMTCEWHVKERPKLDVKILSGLLGKDPAEIEEMVAWLDRYCPANPTENIVSATRKFLREKDSR
jgi:hypothetical protein